jgi:hypothetical protein
MLGKHSTNELHPQPLVFIIIIIIVLGGGTFSPWFFKAGYRYTTKAGLELLIFLSQPPK